MRLIFATFYLCVTAFLVCNNRQNLPLNNSNLFDSRYPKFINLQFKNVTPLAKIVNLNNYTDSMISFNLQTDQKIHIYSVGELVYKLAGAPRQYYLRGDDISISLNGFNNKNKIYNNTFTISFADGISDTAGRVHIVKKNLELFGRSFKGKNDDKGYKAELKFPLSLLSRDVSSKNIQTLFNIKIGDNDDNYKQHAEVALFTQDQINMNLKFGKGNLILNQKGFRRLDSNKKMIDCLYRPMVIDGNFEDWKLTKSYKIDNVIYGNIEDSFDLSANFKCTWDKKFVYVYISILDANIFPLKFDSLKTRKTFLDYGAILDSKGAELWNMHVFNSKHAGGALKNQKIDTVINLKKGKYQLYYSSDECHSYNNWDDDPPATPFYGIILYKE